MTDAKRIGRTVRMLLWLTLALHLVATFVIWAITGSTHGGLYGLALSAWAVSQVTILLGGSIALGRETSR